MTIAKYQPANRHRKVVQGIIMKINTISVDDWQLILCIAHWSYAPDLPKVVQNEAYEAAWKYTDAYGSPGFMPSQGYDWSGFRDSSKASTRHSANAIRMVLAKHGINSFEVGKV